MKAYLLAAVLASTVAAAPAASASRRLSETEVAVARIQIIDLINRYALIHNTDDPQGYADLFTEDGEFGPIKGRAAILEMAKGEVPKMRALGVNSDEGPYRFGFMRSLILNPVIDIIDATHARGVSYLQVVVPDVDNKNVPTILFMGTYQDDYRKVGGKWLIAKRKSYGTFANPELGKKLGLGGR